MDEIGIVKAVNGIIAVVSVERKSACDQCRAGCKLTESGAEIEAVNTIRAAIGQKVKVVMKPYSYLKGALLVYGVPTLALVIGAVIGKEFLSGLFREADPDILSAVSGFGAFLLSFLLIRIWSVRAEKNIEYKPTIEEILE
ncbi:MAG TPA: SoxR reducing system RseC family protein [Thermodesulfovibrionales bacterium]|nr:SoxR reducing system RseC family protein [Thermodesulfovibrionales bacterium]